MNSTEVMGALADEIICRCGNNSNTDDFEPPYSVTWIQYVENYEIHGHQLEQLDDNVLSDKILWDYAKDTRWYCSRCYESVNVPTNMLPNGGW